jgi:hypothetical protein
MGTLYPIKADRAGHDCYTDAEWIEAHEINLRRDIFPDPVDDEPPQPPQPGYVMDPM